MTVVLYSCVPALIFGILNTNTRAHTHTDTNSVLSIILNISETFGALLFSFSCFLCISVCLSDNKPFNLSITYTHRNTHARTHTYKHTTRVVSRQGRSDGSDFTQQITVCRSQRLTQVRL